MRLILLFCFIALAAIAYADVGGEIADEINNVICLFVRLIWLVTGSLMAIVIIFAGVKWLVSGEDAGARASAKTFIVSAFVGLIIVFTAVPVVDYLVGGLFGYEFQCGFFPEVDFSGSGTEPASANQGLTILSAGKTDPFEDDRDVVFRDIVLSRRLDSPDTDPLYACLIVEETGGSTPVDNLEVAAYAGVGLDFTEICSKTISSIAGGGTGQADCHIDSGLLKSIRDNPGESLIKGEIDSGNLIDEARKEGGRHTMEKLFTEMYVDEKCPVEICGLCCAPGSSECHIDVDGGGLGFHTSGMIIDECTPLGGNVYSVVVGGMSDTMTMDNPRCGRCEEGGESVLVGECLGNKICKYVSGEYDLVVSSKCSRLGIMSVEDSAMPEGCEGVKGCGSSSLWLVGSILDPGEDCPEDYECYYGECRFDPSCCSGKCGEKDCGGVTCKSGETCDGDYGDSSCECAVSGGCCSDDADCNGVACMAGDYCTLNEDTSECQCFGDATCPQDECGAYCGGEECKSGERCVRDSSSGCSCEPYRFCCSLKWGEQNCNGVSCSSTERCVTDEGSNECVCREGKKMRTLFVPLGYWSSQEDFNEVVQEQFWTFIEATPLDECREQVAIAEMKVTEALSDPECEDLNGAIRDHVTSMGYNVEAYRFIVGIVKKSPCYGTVGSSNFFTGGIWLSLDYDDHTTLAHELGHYFGLEDEYCSNKAGSSDAKCNDGVYEANNLDARLGCDPRGPPCCDDYKVTCKEADPLWDEGLKACVGKDDQGQVLYDSEGKAIILARRDGEYTKKCDSHYWAEEGILYVDYGVCCYGNKNSEGGRCIMSGASAPGPRAFCDNCKNWLNQEGFSELQC